MKEWYSAKELAGVPGMPGTERSINRKTQTENWQFQEVPAPGGPGGKRREYHISFLPEETRTALLTRQSDNTDLNVQNPSADLETYLTSRRLSLSPTELADPVIQRKIACARAYETCPAYQGREKVLAALATRHGVTTITIRRWVEDVASLRTRRSPRITLGEERVTIPESTAFSPEALAYGLSIYANNIRSGMKAAYDQMKSIADAKRWTLGDYSNFTRLVKKIPSPVWTYIRRGATGFELACVPKIVRQWTAVPVQSVLCGDQKIFDYEVYDPALSRIIIPNGYFWMDCSSRAITGMSLEMGHYNSNTVAKALREALTYGIPDEIFTDWGKPEGSKHIAGILERLNGHSQTGDFTSMSERFGDMSADDVEHHKAQPGKPWMKPIENIMNILDTMMDARFVGGFRKRNNDAWVNKEIQARLKWDRRKMEKGQKMIRPQGWRPASAHEAKGLMTIEAFVQTVCDVVKEHNKTKKKLQEGGVIIPGEFFARGLTSQCRHTLKPETLDYICMPQEVRTPRQSVVKIHAKHDDERGYYSPLLVGRRERVRISYDPYDPQVPAIITDLNGQYLDLGQPWHVQNPYDREGISAKVHRQAELMRWVKVQVDRIREGFDLDIEDARPENAPTPIEKILPVSTVAHEAAQERRIYEIRKDNTTLRDRETAREANTLREDLKRQFAATAAAPDTFIIPTEGKERYIAWLDVKKCSDAGMELSLAEEAFLDNYPQSPGYRSASKLHDQYGDGFIGRQHSAEQEAASGQEKTIEQS